FFSSRRRHTRSKRDWSSDVCSSDLGRGRIEQHRAERHLQQIERGEGIGGATAEIEQGGQGRDVERQRDQELAVVDVRPVAQPQQDRKSVVRERVEKAEGAVS